MSAPSENMPIPVSVPRAKPLLIRHLPYFIGAAVAGGAGRDDAVRRLHPQHPDAGRRRLPSRCSASRSCSACAARSIWRRRRSSVSAPMRSASAPPTTTSSYWLCLVGGMRRCAGGRRLARHVDAAARRALSGDGDDLVPADRHAGHDQRDLAHPWTRTASRNIGRPGLFQSSQCYLAFCVAMLAHRRLFRLAPAGYPARPRDARGARQRTRRRRRRHRCLPHQGLRVCALRGARAGWPAGCSPAVSPMSARTSSRSRNRSCS